MTVQLLHEDNPVGNNLLINDGSFQTNLRLTGQVDTKKPYLLFGNSACVDFTSSGHAKDAQSFGRYGFRFGMRPIFTGKLKYIAGKK